MSYYPEQWQNTLTRYADPKASGTLTVPQVFGIVAEHMLQNPEKCRGALGTLRHRAASGTRDPVGLLVGDDDKPDLAGTDEELVKMLVRSGIPGTLHCLKLIERLQDLHDDCLSAEFWWVELEWIRRIYAPSLNVITLAGRLTWSSS